MRMLSVDWDFFFPKVERMQDQRFPGEFWLYDWGHQETVLNITTLWPIRAAGFMYASVPLPGLTGEERTFWERFQFSPDATLFVAESHAAAALEQVVGGVTHVLSYDAHHDSGYKPERVRRMRETGRIECDEWLAYYRVRRAKRKVVYPRWRSYAMTFEDNPVMPVTRVVDDGQPVAGVFDRVFICRSGAWVPPWVDDQFEGFVAACPVTSRTSVGRLVDRSDWKARAEKDVAVRRELEAQMESQGQ